MGTISQFFLNIVVGSNRMRTVLVHDVHFCEFFLGCIAGLHNLDFEQVFEPGVF